MPNKAHEQSNSYLLTVFAKQDVSRCAIIDESEMNHLEAKDINMYRALQISLMIGLLVFLTAIFCPGVVEADETPNLNFNSTTWRPVRIGAGGYLTGLDISADGSTRLVRTDTYGAYIWNDTFSKWTQLVTKNSMPAIDIKVDNAAGVYEIRVAPNLPTRVYMAYRGYIYRSDSRGSHWARTPFPIVSMNANDNFRTWGQKISIDPINPDVVYFGTPQNGLFVTTDGGASWQAVSGVPASKAVNGNTFPGIAGIVFIPSSGTTAGKTNTILAASYGNGVFKSTNAGASWSAIAGGPKDVGYAVVSSTGIYYAVGDSNSSLWSYADGVWTELLSKTSIQAVAVDPFNPQHIVITNPGGSPNESFNGGGTWPGFDRNNQASTDIPWLANTGYMSIGGLAFDPVVPGKLWASAGVGVWYATKLPPKYPVTGSWTAAAVWNDQSVGIEQLVANQIIVPPGGKPVLASWDRPFFYVNDPEVFPSAYGPVNGSFNMGWSLDYASSDPKFIVGIADWGKSEASGYSTDGGQTWTPFASYPNGRSAGGIAASTPTNIVVSPSNNSPPYYTKDGGVTWKQISIDGVSSNGDTGWGWAYYTNRHIVAADRVVAGTFYIYNYLKGLYRSVDGGANWTLVHSGAISDWSGAGARLQSVPGHAGHLFFTSGGQGGDHRPSEIPLMRSVDGGATWTKVTNVFEVRAFGFGAALTNYPTIYIVGWVNRIYGIWRSDDIAQSWVQVADFPLGSLDGITTIDGDKQVYGTVYVGFGGSGYAYGVIEK
jgi:photosystem II stability/assembly factor-like uncharacterized protein